MVVMRILEIFVIQLFVLFGVVVKIVKIFFGEVIVCKFLFKRINVNMLFILFKIVVMIRSGCIKM